MPEAYTSPQGSGIFTMFVKFILTGDLDFELTKIGLRPEMELRGKFNASNKSIHFNHFYVIQNSCSVWPENYRIISTELLPGT